MKMDAKQKIAFFEKWGDMLPLRRQSMLHDKIIKEYSYSEIGKLYGVSKQSVCMACQRAWARMEKIARACRNGKMEA